MGRPPLEVSKIREALRGKEKKTRLRKGAATRSILDIPDDIINMLKAEGIDLMWATDSVVGQPAPQERMAFEINGWEPVSGDMFGGLFDGMYTRKGDKGEIKCDAAVLMWRPYELTEESRAEESKARDNAIAAHVGMLKSGQLPGFSAGFEPDHPSAVRNNVVERTVKPPMDVPKE